LRGQEWRISFRRLRASLLKSTKLTRIIGLFWCIYPPFIRIRLPIHAVAYGFSRSGKSFKWNLRPWELIGNKYFSLGFSKYEPETQKFLDQFFGRKRSENLTFLNIGANVGIWPLVLSLKYRNIRSLLVEPSPRNTQLLTENLRLNDIDNFEVYAIAAGNYNGTIELFENQELTGLSSVIHKTGTSISVPMHILDQVIAERVDLILIDVEGFEFQVVQGLLSLIEQYLPVLIVEASYESLKDISGLLMSFGYLPPIHLGDESAKSQNKNWVFQISK